MKTLFIKSDKAEDRVIIDVRIKKDIKAQTFRGEILRYPLKDILNAKARVTMRRELRNNKINLPNETNTKTIEKIFNLLKYNNKF